MTTTKVWINGKELPYYEELELKQEISDHHYLTLVCRAEDIPTAETNTSDNLGAFKEHIGGSISVEIVPTRRDEVIYTNDFRFSGMIVRVDDEWQHMGKGGLITLYACSGTIMADGASNHNSFYKQSLSFIAEETLRGYHRNALDFEITPAHPQLTDEILYSVQDGCSDFEYLKRLAAYYGQWLYTSNGKTLILGAPGTTETLLQYGKDLKSMRLEMKPVPNKFMYVTDDYLEQDTAQHQKDTEEVTTSSERIQSNVFDRAAALFPKKANSYHDSPFHDNPTPRSILASRFDKQIEQYTKARALNQVVMIANSDNPGILLGNTVLIQGQGKYRVIKVVHTNTHDGDYENYFEAIEASTEVYPKTDLTQTPKSGSQVAKVTDNADPEGLGRIQVRLPWQVASGKHTPWIRMLTQHAGMDRGAYCIPEIGDEVLVDFQGGNAERPYVVGSLYNATQKPNKEWTSQANVKDNNIKGFSTRSGHAVKLDDTDGGEMITITDKNQNLIEIDTVKNSITINAGEDMILNAKNFTLNVTEEIRVNAGTNMITQVAEDHSLSAKNTMAMVEENVTISAKEILENADKVRIESAQDNLELVSSKQVDIQGSENVKLF